MPANRAASLVPLIAIAALSLAANDASAQRRGGGHERPVDAPREAQAPRARVPRGPRVRFEHGGVPDQRGLADAVRRVERETGGQVLSAERVPFEGRDLNRIKVIDSSGRVRVYMDDPQARARGPQPAPPRTRDDDN